MQRGVGHGLEASNVRSPLIMHTSMPVEQRSAGDWSSQSTCGMPRWCMRSFLNLIPKLRIISTISNQPFIRCSGLAPTRFQKVTPRQCSWMRIRAPLASPTFRHFTLLLHQPSSSIQPCASEETHALPSPIKPHSPATKLVAAIITAPTNQTINQSPQPQSHCQYGEHTHSDPEPQAQRWQ